MALDRNGLEVLSRDECLELLRGSVLGRVVVAMGALPVALPVTFGVLGEDIVFMAGTGTKLESAVRKAVVAFEVDDIDPIAGSGWSVLVTGWSSLVSRPDEVAAIGQLGLEPWVPGHNGHFVRIRSEMVSGRRLVVSGGQWTEGRRAEVPSGGAEESGPQSARSARAITRTS